MTLAAHDYAMIYKANKDHWNADALSRMPIPYQEEEKVDSAEGIHLLRFLRMSFNCLD